MIRKADSFADHDYALREEPPPYLTTAALNETAY